MAENLIQSVQDMLKEETWTRATISGYTQNNLKELADIVEKARNENCVDEILTLCDEHLSHSKDSIIALYLSGIFSLQKGIIDNSSLETLVDIFQKNHKEAIVTSLCESILGHQLLQCQRLPKYLNCCRRHKEQYNQVDLTHGELHLHHYQLMQLDFFRLQEVLLIEYQ